LNSGVPTLLRRHAKRYGVAVEQIIRQQQQSGEDKRQEADAGAPVDTQKVMGA